jgi:hypothetical protein
MASTPPWAADRFSEARCWRSELLSLATPLQLPRAPHKFVAIYSSETGGIPVKS